MSKQYSPPEPPVEDDDDESRARNGEQTKSGELRLPKVALAEHAGEYMADNLRTQHRDELDTRKLRALKL
ncbi:MAG: hypothetical protein AB7S26_13990 [Sandaracinaceae bacterium]